MSIEQSDALPNPESKESSLEMDSPPIYITSLLLYENGNFWYELDCCNASDPHLGLMISNTECTVGTCEPGYQVNANPTVSIKLPPPPHPLRSRESLSYRPYGKIAYFAKKTGQPSSPPTGTHSVSVLQYLSLDTVTLKGKNNPELNDRLRGKVLQIYRPTSIKNIRFGRILNAGQTTITSGNADIKAHSPDYSILELYASYEDSDGNIITHPRVFTFL